jgi:hypothetical protein
MATSKYLFQEAIIPCKSSSSASDNPYLTEMRAVVEAVRSAAAAQ